MEQHDPGRYAALPKGHGIARDSQAMEQIANLVVPALGCPPLWC
jgi:hypothetical protein